MHSGLIWRMGLRLYHECLMPEKMETGNAKLEKASTLILLQTSSFKFQKRLDKKVKSYNLKYYSRTTAYGILPKGMTKASIFSFYQRENGAFFVGATAAHAYPISDVPARTGIMSIHRLEKGSRIK